MKLNSQDIRDIFERRKAGNTQLEIAISKDVTTSRVWEVLHGYNVSSRIIDPIDYEILMREYHGPAYEEIARKAEETMNKRRARARRQSEERKRLASYR